MSKIFRKLAAVVMASAGRAPRTRNAPHRYFCKHGGSAMKKICIITLLSVLLLMTGCANSASDSGVSSSENSSQVHITNEYSSFTGVTLSEKDINEYSTLNNKPHTPQLFCSNGDIIYFSNPDDGLALYSYDGKEAKRLSDIAAFSLNYYNGSVYFLFPGNIGALDTWILPETARSGSLYRYDIESGTVTNLSDTLMNNLFVDENGIFYTNIEESGVTAVYRFDPQSGESERLYRGFGVQHIGDYVLSNEENNDDGLDILLVNGEEKVRILSNVVPFYDCIHKGIYYYRDNNTGLSFHSLDLVSGELKDLESGSDYTIFGDKILLIKNGKLHFSAEGGAEPLAVEPLMAGDPSMPIYYNPYFEYLYTANGKVYAVVWYDRDCYSFARVDISPDAETASVTLIRIEI